VVHGLSFVRLKNATLCIMNVEDIRLYCLNKPGVTESFPFDNKTLVFKVMNKMYALIALEEPELRINLKCDPEKALVLREEYTGVLPGYHMNKVHWNTVVADGSFTESDLLGWIDDSYALIVSSLPRKLKDELNNLP
jgi:predicted DNA-binding protein (MmcQ/YjbR family)